MQRIQFMSECIKSEQKKSLKKEAHTCLVLRSGYHQGMPLWDQNTSDLDCKSKHRETIFIVMKNNKQNKSIRTLKD